jgi:hypothetical protein
MPLSNYEKQKRWRDKNRALYNFQQRQRRKAKGGDATCHDRQTESTHNSDSGSNAELTVQSAGSATIQSLRELITKESEKPVETPVAVPTVFRDDYGRVISEAQWQRLQERKKRATEGGYEIDAYSQ